MNAYLYYSQVRRIRTRYSLYHCLRKAMHTYVFAVIFVTLEPLRRYAAIIVLRWVSAFVHDDGRPQLFSRKWANIRGLEQGRYLPNARARLLR